MASSTISRGPHAFDELSIEICQAIAHHLPHLHDIYNYLRTCRSTHAAVEQDTHSFWHARFMSEFDFPHSLAANPSPETNRKLRDEYLERVLCIRHDNAKVVSPGLTKRLFDQMYLLKEMMVQSYHKRHGVTQTSKNMPQIIRFAQQGQLHSPFAIEFTGLRRFAITGPAQRLLETVQCLIAPTVLSEPTPGNLSQHFPYVYAIDECTEAVFGTPDLHPLFIEPGLNVVNTGLVLKHLNFWKCYLSHDPHNWLYQHYRSLSAAEKPRYWTQALSNTNWSLGRHWRGCYSFFDSEEDLEALRRGSFDRVCSEITFGGESEGQPFQSLELELVDDTALALDAGADERGQWWPAEFERQLQACNRPVFAPRTRAQRRSFGDLKDTDFQELSDHAIQGQGTDMEETFKVKGFINTLPSQAEVPGWQRITMMKYYIDDRGLIDEDALWPYEGVVLPGGKIIVGRWWRGDVGDATHYSGPFLLWCIDDSASHETE